MKTATHTLPAFWASALVNGDSTGIDLAEKLVIHRWRKAHPELGPCLTCSDLPQFHRHHDAPELGACLCFYFVFPLIN